MNWTPDHPDWYLSHWDKTLVAAEDEVTHEALKSLWLSNRYNEGLKPSWSILDVGSGSGRVARDVLAPFGKVTKADILELPDTVRLRAGDSLPFKDGEFDIVHVRRVCCNLSSGERGLFLEELHRVAKVAVVLCEPWWHPWRELRARVRAERPELEVPPTKNFPGLRFVEFLNARRLHFYPIAAEYYYWTRCAGPIQLGRHLTAEDRAAPHPKFEVDMAHTVHRVLVWE